MMHCQDATRALSTALERTLTDGERNSLQLHLAVCVYCRDFGTQVEFIRESMRVYARRPDDVGAERDDQTASSE